MPNDGIITDFSENGSKCGKLGKLIFSAIQHVNKDEGWTPSEIARSIKKYHKLSVNEDTLINAVKVCLNRKNCRRFLRKNDRNGKYYYTFPHRKFFCPPVVSCGPLPIITSTLSMLDNNPFVNGVRVIKPILKMPLSGEIPNNIVASSQSTKSCNKQTQIIKKVRGRPKTNPKNVKSINETPSQREEPKFNVKQTQTEAEKLNKSTSPRFCSVGTMKRGSGRLSSSIGSLMSQTSKHEECQCGYDFEGFTRPKPGTSTPTSRTVKKHPVKSAISSYGKSKKGSSVKPRTISARSKSGQKSNSTRPITKSQEIQDLVETFSQNEKQRRAQRKKRTKLAGNKKKQTKKIVKKSTKTPNSKFKGKTKKQKATKVIKVTKVTI